MGEIGDQGRSDVLQVHHLEKVRRSRPRCGEIDAVNLRDEEQGLFGSQTVEQSQVLRYDSDPPLDRDGIGERVGAEDRHRTAGWLQ
jgi:hypothetical protein